MKAIVFDGSDYGLTERPVPVPRQGEALVRVSYAGVCGTDRAIVGGKLPVQTPLIPGHEFVGEVVRPPAGREELAGRRVVGEMNIVCGQCVMCRMGEPTHCLDNRQLGIDTDGAFAEYLLLPAENLHPVPEGMPAETAVQTEPLAACLRTLELVSVGKEDTVAVLGPGIIGSLSLQVLRSAGPRRIVAVGRSDESLAFAEELGADLTVNVRREEPAERLRELTEGAGADLVIESTGSPEGMRTAAALLRPRGTVVLKSTAGSAVELSTDDLMIRELQLVGSRCGPFPRALEYLQNGAAAGLPVRRYRPEEYRRAMEERYPRATKKLIDFREGS